MPRQAKISHEFPMLAAAGLYATQTEGNGNCLFHALSDQLFGNQSHHAEIRARVTQYMQDNAGLYREFIDVHEGGGLRRNPKRKNAGGYSAGSYSSYDRPVPTEAQVTAAFDAYVARMRVNGTYGDNLEVNAFTNAYGVNVKIWHYNGCAWLSHPEKVLEETRTVHIALHDYEHYSSVRNVAGPHVGLPEVKDEENYGLPPDAFRNLRNDTASNVPMAFPPWKISLVENSLPYSADSILIQRTLLKHHGNVDDAIDDLLGNESGSTGRASTPGSSSIEREQDGNDEEEFTGGLRKKQDRRQSRATKLAIRSPPEKTVERSLSTVAAAAREEAPESPAPSIRRGKISPVRARTIIQDDSDTEEDDDEQQRASSSESSAPSTTAVLPRLRLSQPKPQGEAKPPTVKTDQAATTTKGSQRVTTTPPPPRNRASASILAALNATPTTTTTTATTTTNTEFTVSIPIHPHPSSPTAARHKINYIMNHDDDDTNTNTSTAISSHNTSQNGSTLDASNPTESTTNTATKSKPPPPRVSASAAKDLKKRAQKAAAKERKQQLAPGNGDGSSARGGRGGRGGGGRGRGAGRGRGRGRGRGGGGGGSVDGESRSSPAPAPPTSHFGTLLI